MPGLWLNAGVDLFWGMLDELDLPEGEFRTDSDAMCRITRGWHRAPDPVMRWVARRLIAAGKRNLVVGDASDLMPSALGSNYEFTALQKWFKDPSSTNAVLQALEREVNRNY